MFARFEGATKISDYCTNDRSDNAVPDWEKLKPVFGPLLEKCQDPKLVGAIEYLLSHPPNVQKSVEGSAKFCDADLRGDSEGSKALEATKRVRNNLFHGGKHSGRVQNQERDKKLICCAIEVIKAASCCDNEFWVNFQSLQLLP
jgi:hypothetical protein